MPKRSVVHIVQGGQTLDVVVGWRWHVSLRLDGKEFVSFRLVPGTTRHTLRVQQSGFHAEEGQEDVYEVELVRERWRLRQRCLVTVWKNGQVLHSMRAQAKAVADDGNDDGKYYARYLFRRRVIGFLIFVLFVFLLTPFLLVALRPLHLAYAIALPERYLFNLSMRVPLLWPITQRILQLTTQEASVFALVITICYLIIRRRRRY